MEDTDVPTNILEIIRSSTALTILFVAAITILALLALSRSRGVSGGGSLLKSRKRRPKQPDEPWALLDEKDPAPPKRGRRKVPPRAAKPTKPPDVQPEPTDSGPNEPERAEEIIEELESTPAETSIDDLWDIADGKTPAPAETLSEPSEGPTPPESKPDDASSEPEEDGDPEDPVTWLKLAGKMAAEGRHEEAEACRKTAMDLMHQDR
jgi:hypothetical protein